MLSLNLALFQSYDYSSTVVLAIFVEILQKIRKFVGQMVSQIKG